MNDSVQHLVFIERILFLNTIDPNARVVLPRNHFEFKKSTFNINLTDNLLIASFITLLFHCSVYSKKKKNFRQSEKVNRMNSQIKQMMRSRMNFIYDR